MKIFITNNGCEVSQLYSTYIHKCFLNLDPGIILVTSPREADLIVFYACGLTETKEEKSLSIIEVLKSMMKPSARLVVWGCLSKQNPQSLNGTYIGPIIGPKDVFPFEAVLKQMIDESKWSTLTQIPDANFLNMREAPESNSSAKQSILYHHLTDLDKYLTRLFFKTNSSPFYIRVSEGCTSHCTYCSERLVWGTVRSKSIEKVISEFEDGLEKGYRDFFLCSEDFGAYGLDIGLNACDLLKQLIQVKKEANYRIIINELSPLHLKNMFSDFEQIFASGRISTLGVQVESGSDRILKLMGRQYKAEEWRNLMLYINRKFPSINLSTHLMVGFPTETEEDFRATMNLLRRPLTLQEIVIFKFSPRPGIPAAKLAGQIPKDVIELRARKLHRTFLYTYPSNMAIRYSYLLVKKLSHHSVN